MSEGLRSHLLAGSVRHRRSRHTHYDFTHHVWYLAVDLDELDAVDRRLRPLSVNARNLLALRDGDHLDGAPLREGARARIREAGIDPDEVRVTLVAYPRVLGYVFNPVSFYLCHDLSHDRASQDAPAPLRLVLAEVHNTHGDREVYAFRPAEGAAPDARVFRGRQEKRMYVSPFIDADARYELRVWEDASHLAITIHEREGGPEGAADATATGERTLYAAVRLERRPLEARVLWALLLRDPLVPLKTSALIFWHAVRLRLRGVPWRRYRRAEARTPRTPR